MKARGNPDSSGVAPGPVATILGALKVRNITPLKPKLLRSFRAANWRLSYPGATPDESGLPLAFIFRAFGAGRPANQYF